jgi:hypothetical protein
MGRVARRRSTRLRVRPIGVGAIFVALACGVVAWGVSAAHAEAPTVTFHGGPLAPAVCPASPDHPNLNITEGTWVNVVNRTGATATLEVDGSSSQIAKNGGLSVMLPAGRHDLRLIPDCPVHGAIVPVVIEVAAVQTGSSSEPSASSAGSPPARSVPSVGSAGSGAYPDRGVAEVGTGPSGGVVGGPSPEPDGSPGRAGAPHTDGEASGAVAPGSDPDSAITVVPYAVPETEDPRGARLLAVIATICVFGVTVAIIRAILAQRTTRMVRL